MRDRELSKNEREFVLAAVQGGRRLDLREPTDYRRCRIRFGAARGHAEVLLGETMVLAQTSCEVVTPSANRPTEGVIKYMVELSPMASAAIDPGRPSGRAVELQRIVERALKDSRAVETESLCIVAGEQVWAISCDITVLDDCGNLADATALAALASLLHFRKPHVDVIGTDVTIHTPDSHVPDKLSVHHRPLSVTFAFFPPAAASADADAGSAHTVVDPSIQEEAVSVGSLTLSLNVHNEVCAVHKLGGATVDAATLLECMAIAHVKVTELSAALEEALLQDEANRDTGRDMRPPSLLELSRQRITAAASDGATDVEMSSGASVGSATAAAVAAAASSKDAQRKPDVIGKSSAGLFEGGPSAWNGE